MQILPFFRLIRWLNLLYIALTQYCLQYCIIHPFFQFLDGEPVLDHFHFFLLVLSTVCIAAAGYIINDYFDVKIDEVNRPDRILIDRHFPRRRAMIYHLVFNALGLGLGLYLAIVVGKWNLVTFHLAAVCILWFYSTNFKRSFLIGNVLVALTTALVVFIVLIFEPFIYTSLWENNPAWTYLFLEFFVGYAIFAFLLTMIREVVKDMEDIEGDRILNSKTMPIVLGIPSSRWMVITLSFLTMGFLAFVQYREYHFDQIYTVALLFSFIQIPMMYLIWIIYHADKPSDFKFASNLIKGIMLMGILYLIYFKFTFLSEDVITYETFNLGFFLSSPQSIA